MDETTHFADRLMAAVAQAGAPVCVGIDPNPAKLPEEFRIDSEDPMEHLESVGRWAAAVLEAVRPFAAVVKPQIAYFEALPGPQSFFGLAIYAAVIKVARSLDMIVIGDAKRGDIGSTAEAYAAAHLRDPNAADAVTVNAYFGADGLDPFLDAGRDAGRGAFALVRTSNPSASTMQDFTDAEGRRYYEHVAEQIAEIGAGERLVGPSGYSLLGAVVGATWPDEARRLRELMPQQIFLVPGYGAQGATAEDCAAAFKPDGSGAIVNASRSVIYAHRREAYRGMEWKQAVATAAKDFAADVASAAWGGKRSG